MPLMPSEKLSLALLRSRECSFQITNVLYPAPEFNYRYRSRLVWCARVSVVHTILAWTVRIAIFVWRRFRETPAQCTAPIRSGVPAPPVPEVPPPIA